MSVRNDNMLFQIFNIITNASFLEERLLLSEAMKIEELSLVKPATNALRETSYFALKRINTCIR